MENQATASARKYWYHGIKRGDRFRPVAGPFDSREEAEAIHWCAARLAQDLDGRAWFEDWGTTSYLSGDKHGVLNERLGVKPVLPTTYGTIF